MNEFHMAVFDPKARDYHFDTHIFDWQITPVSSVCEYIESDFTGIFEREDLELTGDINHVKNRRFGTYHPHLFHPPNGVMTQELLNAQYAEAKSKMDWLSSKFQANLRLKQTILYLLYHTTIPNDSCQLINIFTKKSTGRFHVVFAGVEAIDTSIFGSAASSIVMPERVHKPEERRWEGDDNDWDRLFEILPQTVT